MTTSIQVYQLDQHSWFSNVTVAFESPLEPGVYHMPAGCVSVEPPLAVEGMRPRYIAGSWVQEAWSPPVAPEPVALLAAFLARHPEVVELVTVAGIR